MLPCDTFKLICFHFIWNTLLFIGFVIKIEILYSVVVLCTTRVGYYCIHELLLHGSLRGCERNRSS